MRISYRVKAITYLILVGIIMFAFLVSLLLLYWNFTELVERESCPKCSRYDMNIGQCFPAGSAGKKSACSVGDLSLIPGLGRSPGEGNSYALKHPGLENCIDYIVHGVTKCQTQLSDFHLHTFTFSLWSYKHIKEVLTHFHFGIIIFQW